jgi:hypothetical protein
VGFGSGGYEFAWYTAGAADDWKTVIINETGDLRVFDSGFAELVLRLIRDDLGPPLLAGAWLSKRTIGELWVTGRSPSPGESIKPPISGRSANFLQARRFEGACRKRTNGPAITTTWSVSTQYPSTG